MGDIVRKRGRYVYTEGRPKDLINRGGEKISCDEVENFIFGLGQVQAGEPWWQWPILHLAKRRAPASSCSLGTRTDIRRIDRASSRATDRSI